MFGARKDLHFIEIYFFTKAVLNRNFWKSLLNKKGIESVMESLRLSVSCFHLVKAVASVPQTELALTFISPSRVSHSPSPLLP